MIAAGAISVCAVTGAVCGYRAYLKNSSAGSEGRREAQIANFRELHSTVIPPAIELVVQRDDEPPLIQVPLPATAHASGRQKIQAVSFDLFDTLVGRDLPHPESIFDIVEAKTGIENFAALRKEAQRTYCTPECLGGINEVYSHIPRVAKAQQVEWETELEHAVLIRLNVDRLMAVPADKAIIIVSDTLYSAERLRELLAHLHFPRLDDITIFASRSGKADGWIWEILAEVYDIVSHTGDNYNTDVKSPLGSKVVKEAIHSRMAHSPTAAETLMFSMDEMNLGSIIRRISLGNPYDFETEREKFFWFRLHAAYTIPLFGFFLDSIGKVLDAEPNLTRIAAVSRDCILLEPLIQKYVISKRRRDITLVRLDSSRRLLRAQIANPNQDYISYLRETLGGDSMNTGTLIIDINGTYKSLSSVTLKYFNCVPRAHFLSIQSRFYLDKPDTRRCVTIAIPGVDSNALEKTNIATCGSLVDWIGSRDEPFGGPVRIPCEYDDAFTELTRNVIMNNMSPQILSTTSNPKVMATLLQHALVTIGNELGHVNTQIILESLIVNSRTPECDIKMDLAQRFSQILSRYHDAPSVTLRILDETPDGSIIPTFALLQYLGKRGSLIADDSRPAEIFIWALPHHSSSSIQEYWNKNTRSLLVLYIAKPENETPLGLPSKVVWDISGGGKLYVFEKGVQQCRKAIPVDEDWITQLPEVPTQC